MTAHNRKRHLTGMPTIVTVATAAITCALTLSVCACAGSDTASSSESQITIMLDWTPNTNHIGLYVAEELGYFDNENIDVTILPTATAGAETSVENGVANVGYTTLSNVAAVNTQGADLQFVFDITQKPVARWCSLASRDDIRTPADFDGKTFVSFGSAEQTAVVQQMIRTAGGEGEFETATAGTNTFQALTNGQGDFAGFYVTWEGVESELNGPELTCFVASDWGVPGNPDQIGLAMSKSWLSESSTNADVLQRFLAALKRGYMYALENPDEASDILVEQAEEAQLDSELVRASMNEIISGGYWVTSNAGDNTEDTDNTEGSTTTDNSDSTVTFTGTTDLDAAQEYLDFLFDSSAYTDADGNPLGTAPQAADLATNDYVHAETVDSTGNNNESTNADNAGNADNVDSSDSASNAANANS